MRIVLDFNPVLRTPYSGFHTYGCGLLAGLLAHDEADRLSLLCSRENLPALAEIPQCADPRCHATATRIRIRRWERFWSIAPLPSLQRFCGPFEVYHSLHHLMPPTAGRPRVLTVHDLRRYRLPHLYTGSKTGLFERSLRAADRIIAVSNATRDDLVELLHVRPEMIDVVHEGTPAGFASVDEDARQQTLARLADRCGRPVSGFAAAMSSADPRKNLPTVIQAFLIAAAKLHESFRLVIAGQLPKDPQLQALLNCPAGKARIICLGHVSQADWQSILPAARMMLFMSLYEGFGLPVLEAMASGVPVVGSNTSSIPEVMGEAGLHADPLQAEEIARHITLLADDDALHARLSQAGRQRSVQFTWAKAGQQTLESYRRAIGG